MLLIPEPRFSWIIAKASSEDIGQIRTWIEKLDKPVPTVTEEESLDKIENRNQIVQRFIKLKHCTVGHMIEIMSPMIGETGHITAEEQTATLLCVDTVENLSRIEKVIAQFDVAEQDEMVTEVFELRHRSPEEIASLLEAGPGKRLEFPAGILGTRVGLVLPVPVHVAGTISQRRAAFGHLGGGGMRADSRCCSSRSPIASG